MAIFSSKEMSEWVAEYSLSHQNRINKLCHMWGIPLILISFLFLFFSFWLSALLIVAVGLFVIGWALQFIGHYFEGKAPEFFRDWRFLFVGVRWWLKQAFKKAK